MSLINKIKSIYQEYLDYKENDKVFKYKKSSDFTYSYRMSGWTTRQIDRYVQELFRTGSVVVFDHYGTKQASLRTFNILLERLNNEHSSTIGSLDIKRNQLMIKIKNYGDNKT